MEKKRKRKKGKGSRRRRRSRRRRVMEVGGSGTRHGVENFDVGALEDGRELVVQEQRRAIQSDHALVRVHVHQRSVLARDI